MRTLSLRFTLALLAATAMWSSQARAASCANVGNTATFTSCGGGFDTVYYAFRYNFSAGELSSMSIYVPVAGNQLRLALYSDAAAAPNALLAESGVLNPVVGWNTFAMPATAVNSGFHWIAMQVSGSTIEFACSGSGTAYYSTSQAFGAFQGTFPLDTAFPDWDLSFYATLCQPTPTFTATPTRSSTPTFTRSATPTFTASPSSSDTATATETSTATPSPSDTATATGTSTVTPSHSDTATATETPTVTPSSSDTATATETSTQTETPTVTASFSDTSTATETSTSTHTPTATVTSTSTSTSTDTPSVTSTYSDTATSTETSTRTQTPTITSTYSDTATATETSTRTQTPTATATYSDTATATETSTSTQTPTVTTTHSNTSTATPSFSSTATPSYTSTATPTFTASTTPTTTPTASPTSTISPTFTETPAYMRSMLGKSVLAPVPAKPGTAVCLYFDKAPRSSRWEVFGVDQRRLATLDFGADPRQCWDTQGFATGVYYINVKVENKDGSQEAWMQKAMLVP